MPLPLATAPQSNDPGYATGGGGGDRLVDSMTNCTLICSSEAGGAEFEGVILL